MEGADRENGGIQWFLGKWLEVEIADGRIITGMLACTDKDPNIVLSRAEEQWDRSEKPRQIGLAMVARKNIKKIFLLPSPPPSSEEHPTPESPQNSEE